MFMPRLDLDKFKQRKTLLAIVQHDNYALMQSLAQNPELNIRLIIEGKFMGKTLLQVAISCFNEFAVWQLLCRGVEPTIVDAEGKTSLEYALSLPSPYQEPISKILLSKMNPLQGCLLQTVSQNSDRLYATQLVQRVPFSRLGLSRNHLQRRESLYEKNEGASLQEDNIIDQLAHGIKFAGFEFSLKEIKKIIGDLLKRQEVRPVLLVTHLGLLGLHTFFPDSAQGEASKANYPLATQSLAANRKIHIEVDPSQGNVGSISGNPRLCRAVGVTIFEEPIKVYAGGNREHTDLVTGTLVHELTHFVTNEIFKNNANPYYAWDNSSEIEFTIIRNALYDVYKDKGARNSLPVRIQDLFYSYTLNLAGQSGYSLDDLDGELIVRVPQIILVGTKDGSTRESLHHPAYLRLLKYYNEVFLATCKKHIDFIRARNFLIERPVRVDIPLGRGAAAALPHSPLAVEESPEARIWYAS